MTPREFLQQLAKRLDSVPKGVEQPPFRLWEPGQLEQALEESDRELDELRRLQRIETIYSWIVNPEPGH